MQTIINAFNNLFGEHEEPMDNIKADLKEIGCEDVELIIMAQEIVQMRALMKMVIIFWFHTNEDMSSLAAVLLTFQVGLHYMEFVIYYAIFLTNNNFIFY
jgi:hypothetical protein